MWTVKIEENVVSGYMMDEDGDDLCVVSIQVNEDEFVVLSSEAPQTYGLNTYIKVLKDTFKQAGRLQNRIKKEAARVV